MADYFCTHCGRRHEPLAHSHVKPVVTLRNWLELPNRSDRLSLDAQTVADIVHDLDASGMEARQGEKPQALSAKHDSPAPQGETPNPSQDNPQ